MKKSLVNIYKKNKEIIFDIILFGSEVKGKEFASDIDIVIIFRTKDDSVLAKVRSLRANIHVDYVLLDELYKESLWKTIIREGVSVVYNRNVSSIFGLSAYGLFTYNLTKIEKKSRFSQVLMGYKSESMLKKVNGEILRAGVILVPISKVELFRTFLERWNVDYSLKFIYKE